MLKKTRKKPSSVPTPSEAANLSLERLARSDVLEVKLGALPGRARDPANENARAPDRRGKRAPRVELEIEIGIDDYANFYVGSSENISAGGLFVSSLRQLAVGSSVALTFVLPDGVPLFVEGIVRWSRAPRALGASETTPGMGIQFARLGVAEQERIEAFIEGRPSGHYPI